MPGPFATLNGALYLGGWRQAQAALGNYYVVTNPTPGTAIAYAQQVAFSATANGLFLFANTEISGGRTISLDYIKLVQTATAPATTLVMRLEAFNETGLVAMTGNVATRTPVNLGNVPIPATLTVQSFAAGAGTVPAAASGATRRLQSVIAIDTGVTVQHDQYIVQFGGDVIGGTAGLTAARATDPATVVAHASAVTVPPNSTTWINMWWLTGTTNVASFEFEVGFLFQ